MVYGGAEAQATNATLPASATFNGRTLTRAGAIRTPATGVNNGSGIFWMPVQANETGTIRLMFTGTCEDRGIGAVTLVGANTSGPTAVETATGTTSLTDLIATTTPNALVISTATQGNTGELTPTGTGHVRDLSLMPTSSRVVGGHAVAVTPATLTLGYSGTINRIAEVLAAFRVAGPSTPLIPVPNVVGQTQAAAQTAILSVGLQTGSIGTATSASVPAGNVVSQAPAAGVNVASGTPVAIVVSTGPAVPAVVSLTQAAASAAIVAAGLTVGTVTTATHATIPSGSVISQSPVAGVSVASGSAVDLVVSAGRPPVTVPDVVGQTQAAATATLQGLGLVVVSNSQTHATIPNGVVISQTPTGSTQVAGGATVTLAVSTGPAPPPPALAVDKTVFSDGTGTRTTAAFSTASAGEVLVAFVASDGPTSSGSQSVTVSGAGLMWTRVRQVNTQFGASEIWTATATNQLSNVTVVSTQASGGFYQSLTVVAFTGAAGVGASAVANSASGSPAVSLTTTKAGSLVYAVGNDWDQGVARTPGSNQALVHQYLAPAGDTFWVQSRTAPIPALGTVVQMNDTTPTTDRWNFAAVEVISR